MKVIEEEAGAARRGGGTIIIGGGWNARAGNKEENPSADKERSSKDKVINGDGKRLLDKLNEEGLYILNVGGKGDQIGHYTYVGGGGGSVIDYAMVNLESDDSIRKIEIGERTESDHMPIEVNMGEEEGKIAEEEEKTTTKRVWTEKSDSSKKFVKDFKAEMKWETLRKMIWGTMERRDTERKRPKKESNWWDTECHNRKIKMNRCWVKCREGEERWEKFREERREYKALTNKKKKSKMDEITRDARTDKTGEKWWNFVNSRRKRREGLDETIADEEWKKRLMKQLRGTEEKTAAPEREKWTGNPENDITLGEVEKVIRKLEKKKAAGEDEISNEVWKEVGVEAKLALTDSLNKIWRDGKFPEEWRKGIVRPIFKKGEKNKASNYRRITLMSTGYKIYAEILRRRLEKR